MVGQGIAEIHGRVLMSDFIDAFREDANVTALIQREAVPTGINPDGSPIVGPPIEIYNGSAIMWQLTAGQNFSSAKVNNPATHRVVLFPDLVTQPIKASDTLIVDSVAYELYPGENILNQDVYVYDVALRDSA